MNRLGQLKSVEEWERVEGSPSPRGATWVESEQAWNFALDSRHATGARLRLRTFT
jgi:glycogen operon protein